MASDILIVDDESDISGLIADVLNDEGYITRIANNSDTALKAIAERVPSAIILDIWLQGSELDGLGILEMVHRKYKHLPVIMISGHGNVETAVNAIKIGAYDFIEKPFTAERLLLVLNRALESAKLKNENQELKLRGAPEMDLIGNSQVINKMRDTIRKVGPTQSRVLISGAPGTGKEVVARMIHQQSDRANAPFVVMNAASISPAKVEAELFGTEEHSPNGGAEKLGMFERAHGGILFIDEIADMHLETQGRVLRALQDGSFVRQFGDKRVPVNVRVIAATNRDIKKEIEQGRFREDLYYRLNVVPIDMPSLAERREDIPELCNYFIQRASDISGVAKRKISAEAMSALQAYHWQGNIRHLRNMMEWLLIMSGTSEEDISVDMLPPEIFAQPNEKQDDSPLLRKEMLNVPLREAREEFERHYLAAQVDRFNGNISKTAVFVGMERSALHRKLKSLGLYNEEKTSIPA